MSLLTRIFTTVNHTKIPLISTESVRKKESEYVRLMSIGQYNYYISQYI